MCYERSNTIGVLGASLECGPRGRRAGRDDPPLEGRGAGGARHGAARFGIDREPSRADLGILCYPVASMTQAQSHRGSRKNLLGDDPPEEVVKDLSAELMAAERIASMPPTFIWHTYEDKSVKLEPILELALRMKQAGSPARRAAQARSGSHWSVNRRARRSRPECLRWRAAGKQPFIDRLTLPRLLAMNGLWQGRSRSRPGESGWRLRRF